MKSKAWIKPLGSTPLFLDRVSHPLKLHQQFLLAHQQRHQKHCFYIQGFDLCLEPPLSPLAVTLFQR